MNRVIYVIEQGIKSSFTKAKTTYIPFEILHEIEVNIDDIFCQAQFSFVPKPTNFQMDYWFKPYMFEPLSKLKSATQEIVNNSPDEYQEKIKNLLSCIFSNTIRSVSLTYRSEIKLRRLQNEDLRKFNPDVFQIFKARMSQAFERVSHLPPNHKPAHIYQGDARLILEEDNSFDLVITSPPYGDVRRTIPYDTFSRNMLYWLGYPEAEIKNIAKFSLGAKSKVSTPPMSKTLVNALNMMENLQLMKEAIWFYNDYYEAFKEITRVTSQRIIVVIGHRILNNVLFDNASILTELMMDFGWYLEKSYQRKIKGKRIHPKMAFGYNSKGGTIDTESILVFAPNN